MLFYELEQGKIILNIHLKILIQKENLKNIKYIDTCLYMFHFLDLQLKYAQFV